MATHALCIGLNYPGTAYELAGCVNDARDMAKLCKPFCNSTRVILEPTREKAHLEVNALCSMLGRGDTGIVTLSSHGTQERAKNRMVEAIVWSGLELTYDYELDEAFSERDFGSHLFVLADCCHSGGMTRGNPKRSRSIPLNRCHRHTLVKSAPARRVGGYYWLACKQNQYAFDATFRGRPNGAFTYYVKQAYKELKAGATFHDWFQKVAGKRPKGYLPSDDYDQQPVEAGSVRMGRRVVPK